MKKDRIDILKPYFLDILKVLNEGPKRYTDLMAYVRNKRTLSQKLTKLQDYGLVDISHTKVGEGYVNFYQISRRGRGVLKAILKIDIG
ncbi:MAG TPA: winged helix-turn-helix transcriptional regulator [Candidatus Acidoferrales bacterium]|nr:winged helix-turn-helix transcriptional regulator [Candidatus Acidoferrales bacterium]